MAALYGHGHDPVTGAELGRPYPVFKSAAVRIAEEVADLPATMSEQGRAAAIARRLEARVRASPSRSAVAGFDLTFTAPKSASVLWALGDASTQQAVVDAHRAALSGVLDLVESRFLHTRIGAQSCAQVPARGLIAAAFDHFDTRAGDPNLHTHVVIANKVQGPDGGWRSVDGQELYRAAVALSEVYDDLFADQLAARLPVSWSWRERGPRRSPAFEIDGIGDDLLAAFSTRSAQIGVELVDLVEEFTATRGREPSRVEMLRLRQRAILATRPEKGGSPPCRDDCRLAGNRDLCHRQAPRRDHHRGPATAEPSGPSWTAVDQAGCRCEVAVLAEAVLDRPGSRYAARPGRARTCSLPRPPAPAWPHPTPRTPLRPGCELLDQRSRAGALSRCVALDPPALFHSPARFRRLDGSSVFERPSEAAFTTAAVLDAEARLLAQPPRTWAHRPLPAADPCGGAESADARPTPRPRPARRDHRHRHQRPSPRPPGRARRDRQDQDPGDPVLARGARGERPGQCPWGSHPPPPPRPNSRPVPANRLREHREMAARPPATQPLHVLPRSLRAP